MSPREKRINKLINKFYGVVFSFEDLPVCLQKLVNKKGESEIWTNLNFEYGVGVKCLIMVSIDSGKTWRKVIQYNGKQFKVRIISYSNHITKELYILFVNNKDNTSTTLKIS